MPPKTAWRDGNAAAIPGLPGACVGCANEPDSIAPWACPLGPSVGAGVDAAEGVGLVALAFNDARLGRRIRSFMSSMVRVDMAGQ